MSTATKAIDIIRGCVDLMKLGYELHLSKDRVVVVDPRRMLTTEDTLGLAGVLVYEEGRSGRSWSAMLHSVLTNMDPVMAADREARMVTPEQRAEHDLCPVHGENCPDIRGLPEDPPMNPAAYNPFNKQPAGEA